MFGKFNMEQGTLSDLILSIEHGTKLHISMVFLRDYGNNYTNLTRTQLYHSEAICDAAKDIPGGLGRCKKCRNHAIELAVTEKKSFGGFCVNGIYEYCHPIIWNGDTAAVLFIGYIFPQDERQRRKLVRRFGDGLTDTLEKNFTPEDAERTAALIDNYTCYLLEKYPRVEHNYNPLINNIKKYIEENLMYQIEISEIAKIFSYNDKYIGRLFKKETGMFVKEYINQKKLAIAKDLLKNTDKSITEISIASGFSNVTYFNRVFKKTEHKSPSDYRDSVKTNSRKSS